MKTVQGSILIESYTARLEQAITNPSRKPSYVISMHGKNKRGTIKHPLMYFEPDEGHRYGEGDVSEGFRIRVFLHYGDYQNCMDLLRNEKPLFFHYSYLSMDNGMEPELQYYALSTSREEQGEGE